MTVENSDYTQNRVRTFGCNAEGAKADALSRLRAANSYPRIQILTIEELLAGKGVAHPRLPEVTFQEGSESATGGGRADASGRDGD